MAGQGWREFVAGEQLTDTKMQNFLMDQAVLRFPNAGARDSALAEVLSEGMICYLDDTDEVLYYDGTAWEQLTGDPEIFTQGTAGQFLKSLGAAGVEFASLPNAAPEIPGLLKGQTTGDSTAPISLGDRTLENDANTGSNFLGNVAIGHLTATNTTTGNNNIYIGNVTGNLNTTGTQNVAIGSSGLSNSVTGSSNTALGFAAGFGNQVNLVLTGSTFLGANTNGGLVNWGGSNNTVIGFQAAQSTTIVSNEITLGNSSISSLRCQVTTISALSDIRDKTNVQDSTYGLEIINQLRPVTFDWNMRDGAKVGVPDLGFIAQDLAAVENNYDPERLALTLRDNPDRLEATPGRLIPILVKAIQELSAEIQELKNAR